MATLRIERASPESWERVRALRLRALRDTPDAFARTSAEEEALLPEAWRARLASPDAASFLALRDGAPIGLAVGGRYAGTEGAAGLFGMWVAPEARGCGAADALVDAVVQWARARGHERVLLDVADSNHRAIRLYERKGFAPTGVAGSLPAPRQHVLEHQRALALGPQERP